MNEEVVPAAGAAGPTAGQLLRQAREAAGLHVASLAVALKVPVRKLEALEDDRYDQLPDAVFVRALASSVCRTLKVDPHPILERLPQSATPRLVPDDDGINAPFRAPGDARPPGMASQLSRPVVLTVLALLVGAVVLVFLPLPRGDDAPAKTATATTVAQPAPLLPAPAAAPAESVPAAAETPASAAAPAASAAASAPAAVAAPAAVQAPALAASRPVPVPSAPVVAVPAAPAAVAAASAPPATGGVLVLRAKGDSWVKVTDAKGTTVIQKLLVAGESAAVGGALPLAVTVGNAKSTEVEVRGRAFDLSAWSNDNVARFEVK